MVRNLLSNAGDGGSIPGSRGSPAKGNGNPLQYSCLGNSMDRGAWRAAVHRVTEADDLAKEHKRQVAEGAVTTIASAVH